MKRIAIIGAGATFALALVACTESSYPVYGNDQALRATRFDACMASLPKGPDRITAAGNDWEEVVAQCERVAYNQSRVCVAHCQLAAFEKQVRQ